jgi:hypothetical protein
MICRFTLPRTLPSLCIDSTPSSSTTTFVPTAVTLSALAAFASGLLPFLVPFQLAPSGAFDAPIPAKRTDSTALAQDGAASFASLLRLSNLEIVESMLMANYTMRRLIIAALAIGCSVPCDQRYGYRGDDGRYASVAIDRMSPAGIRYSGDLDPDRLDDLTDSLEQCLLVSIDRSGFVVIVPTEIRDGGHGPTLPIVAETNSSCGKGLEPTTCYWRAMVVCHDAGLAIVTTPDLSLYRDALARITLQRTSAWYEPSIASCL